ncbi:ABC transporter permease subunit [Thiohalophilus sp.]|uniref:ABC transporter permease subunit n=1 Tax=Thiohalophilus sp. TaxID=3028392 RepID=UPI003975F098
MTRIDHSNLLMRWRMLKDTLARHGVAVGGLGVIVAITLILVYLLAVVLPMFQSASIDKVTDYSVPGSDERTLHLAMEEQAVVGLRLTDTGRVIFFNTWDGTIRKIVPLPIPDDTQITSWAAGDPASRVLGVGLSNGQALVFKHHYQISFSDALVEGGKPVREITPEIQYPLGEDLLQLDTQGRAITHLAVQSGEEETTVAGLAGEQQIQLLNIRREESFLGDDVTLEETRAEVPRTSRGAISHLLVDKQQRNLYVVRGDDNLSHYDLFDKEAPSLQQHLSLFGGNQRVTSLEFLTGDISLLAGSDQGTVLQLFPVPEQRDSDKRVFRQIRSFDDLNGPIKGIAPEYNRKGFLAVDGEGQLGIFHTTANRTLLTRPVADALQQVAISPRAKAALLQSGERLHFYHIDNEHPEISMSSLWGKVWYESYDEPEYVWQSSSSSNDHEPKLSLVPLSFGTLKAAFYAMLFAIPLSIMGAIYTAHFMAPRMRQTVKPSIEIMEALPTVIIGFLAGLWLAPFLERHLPGIFSLLIIMPFGLLLVAYGFHRLPDRIRHTLPEGWEAAWLIPIILLIGYASFSASPWMEAAFFGGDVRIWMSEELGISYDQRNSLVIGLAMGFAVIPTIFSIAEDAIFAVPKHLVQGSLAMGATSWQTMMRVVLLTASPGIFSAVMIGLGRAVGETMIVLMATGNTPLMDMNIFEGMRTLSANIAVEMPESEVDSTHYRVLFLAALVLFAFTFLVNTAAEIVRQRLRKRYSSL